MPPPRPTPEPLWPRGDRRSCCAKSGFARVMSVPYPLSLLGLLTSSRTVRVLRSRRKIVKITLDFRKFWEILGNDGDTIVRRPSLANQVPLGWNTAHRDSDAAPRRLVSYINRHEQKSTFCDETPPLHFPLWRKLFHPILLNSLISVMMS